jgi:RNA-directed DNA polymerase
MDGESLFPTEEGTPQGGVISPLLANIALHGLETEIRKAFLTRKFHINWKPTVVRYADDFVILHPSLEAIHKATEIAQKWLSQIGLELKPSKTQITHTLHECEGKKGFDFLGFNIRQYKVGKTHSAMIGGFHHESRILGFKTLIKPSKQAQKRHVLKLKGIIKRNRGSPQIAIINKLSPIIRGWSNYYSHVVSSKVFGKMGCVIYHQLRSWGIHKHPHKSEAWVYLKYWKHDQGHLCFMTNEGHKLYQHQQTEIVRHAKVTKSRSPYDGDWIYWAKRMGMYPEISNRLAYLLKVQKGKCMYCGLYFKHGDIMEVDHIIPKNQEGSWHYTNLQLLHRHCHYTKTAKERGSADNRPSN